MSKKRPEPTRLRPDAEATIASAVAAIQVAQRAPGISRRHRELIVTTMLWKVTEARWGKYNLFYRSREGLACERKLRRHEHVFPRARTIRRILEARPEDLDGIVQAANVACLVTKHEADALNRQDKASPDVDGWDRYRKLGIRVVQVDTEGNVVDFLAPPPA